MIEIVASCMAVGPVLIVILTFQSFPTCLTFLKLLTLLTFLTLIPILMSSCSSKKKTTDPRSFPDSHQVPRNSSPVFQNRKRLKSMTRTFENTDVPRHKRRSSLSGQKSSKGTNSPMRRGSEAKSKRQFTPQEIEKLIANAEKVDRNCQLLNNDEPETSNAGLTEMVILKLREKQKIAVAKKLEELTTARSLELPDQVINSKERFQDLKLCSKTQVYNESDILDIRQI